ncbi:MAG: hypothetical protein ACTSWA_03255 [Candidatus Thorarchaeota archaeon]
MAKNIVLIGPESSGKTFFLNAMSVVLEKREIGHMEDLHPELGNIIDYALAEYTPQITPTSGILENRIRLGRRSYVNITEVSVPNSMYEEQRNLITSILSQANCAVVFIGSKVIEPLNEDGDETHSVTTASKVKQHARVVNPLLLKEFKPWWKFFRKLKRIYFVTTNAQDGEPNVQWFRNQIVEALPDVMKYISKRKIENSFHTIELIKKGGGINIEHVGNLLEDILSPYIQ